MLKGLIIAASKTEVLKENLTKEGFPWTELKKREKEDFLQALSILKADKNEVLCLVETDRDEKLALDLGLVCVGYLNPQLLEESLSGCRILLEGFQEIDSIFLRNIHTRAMGFPVQIAETSRLLIREMTLEDLDDINALYKEGGSACLMPEFSLDKEEEKERIRTYILYMYGLYQFGMWVVIEKKSQRLIGRVGFGIADYLNFSEIDMGYLIGRDYRRRGYAEEACRAALSYANQVLDFPGVSAYIDKENVISLHLIEKLGFCQDRAFAYQGKRMYRYQLSF